MRNGILATVAASLAGCGGDPGSDILGGDLEGYDARRDYSLAQYNRVESADYMTNAEYQAVSTDPLRYSGQGRFNIFRDGTPVDSLVADAVITIDPDSAEIGGGLSRFESARLGPFAGTLEFSNGDFVEASDPAFQAWFQADVDGTIDYDGARRVVDGQMQGTPRGDGSSALFQVQLSETRIDTEGTSDGWGGLAGPIAVER